MLMTVPFGMYLRYYFKCNFKKTILYTFLLSLFFELTQLTGLYYIYPYPYRFFDVDDLLINTLGGILGYGLMGLFTRFLPSRDEIDNASIEKGKTVSGLRRITLFCLDMFLFLLITNLMKSIFHGKQIGIIIFLLYYIAIPYLFSGKTLAGSFLNVKLEFENNKLLRLIFRIFFLFFYYFYFPLFLWMLSRSILFLLFLCLFYFYHIVILLKNKKMYYDYVIKVTYVSTIQERKITSSK